MVISKSQAQKLLLTVQMLYPPQSLSGDDAVETVFNHLRVIQYDPLNPCGRNADLVLQSRIGDYHPNGYYHWLYEEKKGVEWDDKELCIIPREDVSFITHHHRKDRQRYRKSFLQKYQREIDVILERISSGGSLSSAEILTDIYVDSVWGTQATFGRRALEILWKTGELVVIKREHGKKYYDLASRVHESGFPKLDAANISERHIIRRLRSVGILPFSGSGGGWQGMGGARRISKLLLKLKKKKQLLSFTVEGGKREYVTLLEFEEFLSAKESPEKNVVFLAPLDNLMWDREMIEEIFEFRYRWEVYTPLAKRQYGYYVLPILYGDTFIGRIEPVLRKDRVLEIKGLWKEKSVDWDFEIYRAFDRALESFARYVNATSIQNPF